MRQIMASALRGDSEAELEFVYKPLTDSMVLRIPEPGSSNAGPTGFFGVADYIRSKQELEIEVERSGDYVSYDRDEGARFIFKPDFLRDGDDDDVVDDLNPLGAEREDIPVYNQTLFSADNDVLLGSPRIIELKKWGRFSPDRGIVGLLGVVRWTGTGNAPTIRFWTLDEYDDLSELPLVSYQWDYNSALTMSPTETSTEVPGFDMVEMDDGSIVSVFSTNNALYFYKTFDCGVNWVKVGEVTGLTTDRYWVAIDRIGSRLVVTYSRTWAGPNYGIYSRTCDDGGYTWSSVYVVIAEAVVNDEVNMDLNKGKDGVLYIAYNRTNNAFVTKTLDGATWSTPVGTGVDADAGLSITQEYHGLWVMYSTDVLAGTDIGLTENHTHTKRENPYTTLWTSGGVVANQDTDGDGLDDDQISARVLGDGGFIDVAVLKVDTHSGTTFYNVQVYRLAMWVGVQLDSAVPGWSVVWTAHAYPSTNDPHPNLNAWTEASAGTGSIAPGSDNDFYHMEIDADAISAKNYRNPAAGTDGWWDTGATARFELKAIDGRTDVNVRLTSAGSNKSVEFTLFFTTTAITLWDVQASAVVQTFTPVNWDPADWNEYLVIVLENEVQVFRSPSGVYREIVHYELTVASDALQEDAYAGAGDSRVWWGSFAGELGVSDWRSVMVSNAVSFDVDWDFTALVGKKCHFNPVGLMQGIACKWDGEFALDGDVWELDVGAHYDAPNILLASPRVRWAEPEHAGACSVDQVFDWRYTDDDGDCMNAVFDALAVFGLNTPIVKVEGADILGLAWATVFDNAASHQGGPIIHDGELVVSASYPDQNVIRFGAGTSNLDTSLVLEQLCSDTSRRFYVYMVNGSRADRIYRIVANTDDELLMELNVEAEGVSAGDDFYIFSDRFYFRCASQHLYPRIRLTLATTGVTPSPGERQARLGTVVLGRVHDLPDDEWGSVLRTESGVRVEEGRGRIRQWREEAPARRVVDLSYSGRTDKGMGVEAARELFRCLRWGIYPLVWIDDDLALDAFSNACHVDPIIAKVGGPVSQRHRAYRYLQEDGSYHVRSIHDFDGVVLEEVL